MKTKLQLHLCILALLCFTGLARAQGTAFTYTGRLNDNNVPVNGAYDLRFTLFDTDVSNGVIAVPIPINAVDVVNGLFTVRIDFGENVFTGPARWLNIEVQPVGGGGFKTLTPRQEVTASPYAIRAATAGTAAAVANGSVVKSLNNLRDDLTLAAGANVTITPNGNTLTLAAAGAGGSGIWSVLNNNASYAAGNVGIGTTVPATALEANGIVRSTRSGIAPQYIQLNGGDSGSIKLTAQSTLAAEKILFLENLSGEATPGPNNNMQFVLGTTASRSTKMTITSDGNVGIGTTTPFARLSVAGDASFIGRILVNNFNSGNVTLGLQTRSGDNFPFMVRDSSGNNVFSLQVGFNSLSMYGDAQKSSGGTSWSTWSDQRLKQDVRPFEAGLNEVLQLRPVRFRYRDDPERGLTSSHEEVGFIAQAVREVIPDAVTEGQDGYLTLKADPIHWAAITAIQELNAKLEARSRRQDARIESLEKSVTELREMVQNMIRQSNGGTR